MRIRQGAISEIKDFAYYTEDNDGDQITVVIQEGKVVAYVQHTDGDIYFIESEAAGAGSLLISHLKERYGYLIAKSVEDDAKVFWQKMGFQFLCSDGYGGEDWDWEI